MREYTEQSLWCPGRCCPPSLWWMSCPPASPCHHPPEHVWHARPPPPPIAPPYVSPTRGQGRYHYIYPGPKLRPKGDPTSPTVWAGACSLPSLPGSPSLGLVCSQNKNENVRARNIFNVKYASVQSVLVYQYIVLYFIPPTVYLITSLERWLRQNIWMNEAWKNIHKLLRMKYYA